MNGVTFGHDIPIRTSPGSRVRLTMVNETMMAHPMHIHGHTWSLPGNGGLRKDTVLVLPMQTVTADLQADNPGRDSRSDLRGAELHRNFIETGAGPPAAHGTLGTSDSPRVQDVTMIPSKSRECQRVSRRAGQQIAAALAASISAVIFTVVGATTAFALPAGYPAEGPSAGATTTPDPDPHASMPGMDPNMPGMTHDETPGMDPNMPGMSHDETPGMDPDMPGMSESGTSHAHAATAGPESRPQAAVVGTFAVLNGGVLLTAGLMRRRAKLTAHKPSRGSQPAK